MRLSLPICGRQLLLSLLFCLAAPTFTQAQSLNFEGFRNDCANIQFRASLGFIDQFVIVQSITWELDGAVVQTGNNRVYQLDQTGTELTATFAGITIFGAPFTFPVSSFLPTLPAFTLNLDNNGVIQLTGPNDAEVVTATANRCVGSNSWQTTVDAFNGSPSDLSATVFNQTSNQSPASAKVFIGANVPNPTGAYTVEIQATETLSGFIRTRLVLVTFDPGGTGCIICPGFLEGTTVAEEELITAAVLEGVDKETWDAMDGNTILQRQLDLRDARLATTQDIDQEVAPISFAAFPNPAANVLNVTYKEVPAILRLVDASGREVRRLQAGQLGPDRHTFNVADLPNGFYALETLRTTGERSVQKIQILR